MFSVEICSSLLGLCNNSQCGEKVGGNKQGEHDIHFLQIVECSLSNIKIFALVLVAVSYSEQFVVLHIITKWL